MRRIGLIGGMSWHSTLQYYRVLQEETARRYGGHASAPVTIDSLDFAAVRALQLAGDWQAAGALLADSASRLEAAGADVVLIATNLMHKVAPAVEAAVGIPLLHIADAVAAAAPGPTLGLLGTRWTMEEPFYADRLARHGLTTLTPGAPVRAEIDAVVFDELTQGIVSDRARTVLAAAATDLARRGADAVILGCTELELALRRGDVAVPLIDSMRTHALAALDAAMAPAASSGAPTLAR